MFWEIRMRLSTHKFLYFLAIAVFSAGCSQDVSYKNDVDPILQANCLSCHDGQGEFCFSFFLSLVGVKNHQLLICFFHG